MSDISDEELDSEGFASGFSDDDFGLGSNAPQEGILLSDLLGGASKSSGPPVRSSEHVEKQEITSRAQLLRKGSGSAAEADGDLLDPLLHSDSDGDDPDSDDNDALHRVVLAATGRNLQQRSARSAALDVEVGVGPDDPLAAPLGAAKTGRETMDKLMNALEGAGSRNLGALKKRVARLDKDGKKALDAPLPEVVAGRLERAAAYQKTTDDISQKWGEVVKTNRRATHLSFPLGAPKRAAHQNTAGMAASFTPEGDFEKQIEKLLQEGGISTERDAKGKENKELRSTLTKDEFLARRRELAKTRSLMFEYERKMKRIKKIKSKKFRRIMKNEKLRLKEEQGEMSGSDAEDVAAGRIAAEKRRVEERMTLRHKNTSKWVRRQLSRGETKRNPEARAAVDEQLRLHDELRRRQEGVMELSDSEKGESDREIDDVGSDVEAMDKELDEMKKDIESGGKKKRKSGLMDMKFMQAAAERERKDALALLNEMGSDEEEGLDEYGSDKEAHGSGEREAVPGIVGRRSFLGEVEPAKETKAEEKNHAVEDVGGATFDDSDDEGEALDKRIREEYDNDAAALGEGSAVRGFAINSVEKVVREFNDAPSGFVTSLEERLSAKSSSVSQIKVKSGVSKESYVNSPSGKNALGQEKALSLKKSTHENVSAKEVQLPASGKRVRFDEPGKKEGKKYSSASDVPIAKHNELSVAVDKPVLGKGAGGASGGTGSRKRKKREESESEAKDRKRMEMVARAFAGLGGADEADFEASKKAEIDAEIDAETSANVTKALPGWGSWDGAGAKKKKRRKSAFAEAAQRKLDEARANAIQKRPDKNNSKLQLSTQRSHKAAALTLAAVPFPFRSREEWEREVSVPIVREVVAGRSYRTSIQGAVSVKKGEAILPIQEGQIPIRARRETKAKGKRGVIDRRKKAAKSRESKRRSLMS